MNAEGNDSNNEKEFITTLILVTGYLFIQLLANLTVKKTTSLSIGITLPIGSILYAISFTWIDLVHDFLGKNRARILVLVSILANIFTILWFEFYIRLEGTALWYDNSFNQNAIEFVLGGVFRIYAASLITNFIVENTDISVFHHVRCKFRKAPRWFRSFISNSVSAPLDAILFTLIAFWGTMPAHELISIIVGGAIFKMLIGYTFIPIIYLVKERHKVRLKLKPINNFL